MWQIISNIASVLSIASAIITCITAGKIKTYYEKIVTQYSVEKITIAELKSLEAKKEYQQIKSMYLETRGRKAKAYSDSYMKIDNNLDDIKHSLPSGYEDISRLIKEAKVILNKAVEPEVITQKSSYFLELGTYLDNIYEGLESEKSKLQEKNVKNIKGVS